jgi:phosphoribosylglycinamide formyltransferase-1
VECDVDVILLAGYMKQIGPETLSRFRGRILNTHPALLPKFGGKGMYGLHVHRAVLAAGESKTVRPCTWCLKRMTQVRYWRKSMCGVEPTDTPETFSGRRRGPPNHPLQRTSVAGR